MTGEIVPGWSQRLHLCCNFMSIQTISLKIWKQTENTEHVFMYLDFLGFYFLILIQEETLFA